MAIHDASLMLAGAVSAAGALTPQLITALGATAGNGVVDMGPLPTAQNTAIGQGDPNVRFTFAVLQSLTSGGAATVQFQLVQADDTALTSNVQVLAQTDAFGYATLTAGKRVVLRAPHPGAFGTPKRYFGARVVVAGAVLTNASGWLTVTEGADVQDLGPSGQGTICKGGFSVV